MELNMLTICEICIKVENLEEQSAVCTECLWDTPYYVDKNKKKTTGKRRINKAKRKKEKDGITAWHPPCKLTNVCVLSRNFNNTMFDGKQQQSIDVAASVAKSNAAMKAQGIKNTIQ